MAKICSKLSDKNETYNYLIEAKQSAEFLNESSYIIDASVELGDFYYNNPKMAKKALKEYFSAKKLIQESSDSYDVKKINERIEDMRLRMGEEDFNTIREKYE